MASPTKLDKAISALLKLVEQCDPTNQPSDAVLSTLAILLDRREGAGTLKRVPEELAEDLRKTKRNVAMLDAQVQQKAPRNIRRHMAVAGRPADG